MNDIKIEATIPTKLFNEIEEFSNLNNIPKDIILKDALNLYLDFQDIQEDTKVTADPNNKPLSADEFFDGLDF